MAKKKESLTDFVQEKIDQKGQTKKEAVLEKRKKTRATKEADRERSNIRKEKGDAPPQGEGQEKGGAQGAARTSVLNRPGTPFHSAPSVARLSENRPKL